MSCPKGGWSFQLREAAFHYCYAFLIWMDAHTHTHIHTHTHTQTHTHTHTHTQTQRDYSIPLCACVCEGYIIGYKDLPLHTLYIITLFSCLCCSAHTSGCVVDGLGATAAFYYSVVYCEGYKVKTLNFEVIRSYLTAPAN